MGHTYPKKKNCFLKSDLIGQSVFLFAACGIPIRDTTYSKLYPWSDSNRVGGGLLTLSDKKSI